MITKSYISLKIKKILYFKMIIYKNQICIKSYIF
uniref:Uncharacterized protein n=1 Tax=Kapraunia schneideri TaxID=717899 RepID=A0A1Z1MRU9_9FLOR|nr:hypothetical protein [Kapraunia schneideri]ARW68820.1 hypothetical protein [Kapraunia schneideri]